MFTHHIHIPALSFLAVDSYKSSSFVVIAVRMHACEYSMIYLANSCVVGIAIFQHCKNAPDNSHVHTFSQRNFPGKKTLQNVWVMVLSFSVLLGLTHLASQGRAGIQSSQQGEYVSLALVTHHSNGLSSGISWSGASPDTAVEPISLWGFCLLRKAGSCPVAIFL